MIGAEQAIAAAYSDFKRGSFDAARARLSGIAHPQAIHLLGLVEKGAGRLSEARALLERAAALDPENHEIANNQGRLALQMGDLSAAEAAFRRALDLKGDFYTAAIALGRTLSELGRHPEALAVLDAACEGQPRNLNAFTSLARARMGAGQLKAAEEAALAALAIDPKNTYARYSYASVLVEAGRSGQAGDILKSLVDDGASDPIILFLYGRTLFDQGRISEARDTLERAHAAGATEESLTALAELYWMTGDETAFDGLIEAALAHADLALPAIVLLRQAGREEAALGALERQPQDRRDSHRGLSVRCALLLALDRVGEAIAAGRAAVAATGDLGEDIGLITGLLRSGDAGEALDRLRRMRDFDPQNQLLIGYEATALRELGHPDHRRLVRLDEHVRTYELPVPDGFRSLEAFNTAFLERLDGLRRFDTRHLNQSFRAGSQTPNNLTDVDDPVIQAYVRALDGPIRDYMAAIGAEPGHPLTERNTGAYAFAGMWSVRLEGGGRHLNHVHPRGWISSSYYAATPPETASSADKAGWIKFGEPPFKTPRGAAAEKWVQPRPGLLVLFPSFLWHGTEPIRDGSLRVTAPFDVVPV